MKTPFLMFLVFFCFSATSFAEATWKWRAREHFEVHTLKKDANEVNYRGLSNTINYWYEEPFHQAIGFAFGPVIGDSVTEGQLLQTELGRKIKLSSLGAEYKKWVNKELPLFVRFGFYYETLKTEGTLGTISGTSFLYGFGYEYVFKGVGIAIEISKRHSNLESGVEVESFTPSIGFHLYPFL